MVNAKKRFKPHPHASDDYYPMFDIFHVDVPVHQQYYPRYDNFYSPDFLPKEANQEAIYKSKKTKKP